MQINTQQPPEHIYKPCKEKFGIDFDRGTIFTVGEDIHIKNPDKLSQDLLAHELVHIIQQQEIGADNWWERYLEDDAFRLEQEIEAYGEQYRYAQEKYNRQQRRLLLKEMSENLSGKMYGNLLSKEQAKELIMNYEAPSETKRNR